ncbi:MAG TPA: outer membrane lipoprotein carrier protein LolA [Methylotenera sp.]|nr:outer membrane lipoprotein carrier protein LolA [Methylotenera sp.]
MQSLTLSLLRASLILLSAIALPCIAETETNPLASIGTQIEQHAVVRADFTQTKHMAALKRPLITSGKLIYSRNHGVLWQIEQPYRISYLLSEERIIEINAKGLRKERNTRDIPGLAQVGKVFRAMLGANISTLKNTFDVAASGNTQKWEIQLTPKQTQLKQFLTALDLNGGLFVENIKIAETGGDSTQIQLHRSKSSDALEDNELRLFAETSSQ